MDTSYREMMNMLNPEMIYKKDPSIVFREICDEFLLIPVRKSTEESNCIYTLNQVSARIWQLIDGKTSLAEIRDTVVEEYDVDAQTADTDLNDIVQKLVSISAIKKA